MKIRILGLVSLLISFFFFPTITFAWETTQNAQAICMAGAGIQVSVVNNEPDKQKLAMDVTATDEQTNQSVNLGSVAPGQKVEAVILTGKDSLSSGQVRFDLTWTDGHNNQRDSFLAEYNAIDCSMPTTEQPRQEETQVVDTPQEIIPSLGNEEKENTSSNIYVAYISFGGEYLPVVDLEYPGQDFGWDEAGLFAKGIYGVHKDDIFGRPRSGTTLSQMEVGQIVRVYGDEEFSSYKVTRVFQIPRSQEEFNKLNQDQRGRIRVFTCSGVWNGEFYSHYLVVEASRIPNRIQ